MDYVEEWITWNVEKMSQQASGVRVTAKVMIEYIGLHIKCSSPDCDLASSEELRARSTGNLKADKND